MRVRYGKPIKVKSLFDLQNNSTANISNTNRYFRMIIANNTFETGSGIYNNPLYKGASVSNEDYLFLVVKTNIEASNFGLCYFTQNTAVNYTNLTEYKIGNIIVIKQKLSTSSSDTDTYHFRLSQPTQVTYKVNYAFLLNASEIGLDTLTAQEFYNKYNKYFPLIATGEEITIDDKAGQVSLFSQLPRDFQQVEYIESTGTQYIDTQWIPTSNSQIKLKFQISQLLSGISDQSLFGLREGNYRYNLYLYQTLNLFSIGYGTIYNEQTLPISLNQDYSIIYTANGTNATLSGDFSKTVTSSHIPVFTQTLWLFDRHLQSSYTSASKIKICKIYDSGILVRDFIPCYRKSDNEIGLYDLVGKQFYTNAGTGTFLKGPNVNNTISCKVAGGSNDIYYGYNSIFDFSASIWVNDNADTFTMTKTEDKLSFECHTAGSRTNKGITNSILVVTGHKYLLSYDILSTVSYTLDTSGNTVNPATIINMYPTSVVENESTTIQMIVQASENSLTWRMGRGSTTVAVGDTIEFNNIYIIDLTNWFGVGKEPTTVEEFKATFPNKYYPYSSKSLLNKYMINALGIK